MHIFQTPKDYETKFTPKLAQGTVVVFDVLRATSTMITALASGFENIHPCKTVEEAFALKKKFPKAVLAGERNSFPVEGFDRGNSPEDFLKNPEPNLIMTTTNGTRALHSARNACKILIGAFLNLSALVNELRQSPEPWSVFCAGTHDEEAEEDVLAAGALLSEFHQEHPLRCAYQAVSGDLAGAFREGKNGRRLVACGLERDMEWCARVDVFPIVGVMRSGVITPLE